MLQIAQAFFSYSRRENRSIAALCNRFRNAEDGKNTSKVVYLLLHRPLVRLTLHIVLPAHNKLLQDRFETKNRELITRSCLF
jgi:elongation factor P--beta-lysine ligase